MNQISQDVRSKGKKVELIIQQLNTLPTLPAVAARLLQLTIKNNTQAQEVVQLIESDPALASRIMALATRASTGISKKAATVSKIVVLLGFDAIRNAVLSIKVFETLGGMEGGEDDIFDRPGFWKHSLAVGCAAQLICRHMDRKLDPEEAFLCGLLHDMGKIALSACLPKSFGRVVQLTESSVGNIAELEQRIMGVDHTIIGKRLAQKWNLPDVIVESVWLHQQWPGSLPEAVKHRSMVQTIYLADLLAREQRIGYSGNHTITESSAVVAMQLGCQANDIEDIARKLRAEIAERAVLLGLDDIQPQEMYHEALGHANDELGRLNLRLSQQNQRLEMRSRFFDLLTELGEGLEPGQTVSDVTRIAARTWCKRMDCVRCAVYCRNERAGITEGAMVTAENGEPTLFIVDAAGQEPDSLLANPAEDFPQGFNVAGVENTHGWFFEQVCAEFMPDETYVIPLQSADEVIGGIIWQPGANGLGLGPSQEIKATATGAALAVKQALWQERMTHLCEQLAQANQLLQETQQELLTKRSLAAVGEMACGAAHEINNPLAVIVGRSQLLAESEKDAQRKGVLELIARQGQEVTKIISDLLDFARPSLPKQEARAAAEIITQAMAKTREHAERAHVTVQMHLEEPLPELYVDGDQVASALCELVANAIDSYQNQSGAVRIRAYADELESEVIIDVIDEGCGMTSEVLQKAFAPFFSARQAGRRRGLGLSRSRTQIENNGGHVRLMSEPGKGSTARVSLPVYNASCRHDGQAVESSLINKM